MTVCSSCATDNRGGATFCSSCGQRMLTPTVLSEPQRPSMPKTDRTSLGAPASGQIVYVQGTKTNGLAVASLVLGLVWLCGIGSLLAVIFGHVALGQIKRSEGRESGRGLAIAGAILGWIGVGLFTIGLIINATASN